MSILDLAYRPGGTPIERSAHAAGARVLGGLEFLARQGACQFALWTRRIVGVDLFRDALKDENLVAEGGSLAE
jgi:shikimate 5-dehydrogenase